MYVNYCIIYVGFDNRIVHTLRLLTEGTIDLVRPFVYIIPRTSVAFTTSLSLTGMT